MNLPVNGLVRHATRFSVSDRYTYTGDRVTSRTGDCGANLNPSQKIVASALFSLFGKYVTFPTCTKVQFFADRRIWGINRKFGEYSMLAGVYSCGQGKKRERYAVAAATNCKTENSNQSQSGLNARLTKLNSATQGMLLVWARS